MYTIETNNKTSKAMKGGKIVTTTTTTVFVDTLMEGYMEMLKAFDKGEASGMLINSETGELHMTFTREDDNAGVELKQWLSNELMAYMTKGASICCIPEDKAQAYREEECSIQIEEACIWEEDDYDDEVIVSEYELRMIKETMYPRRNY